MQIRVRGPRAEPRQPPYHASRTAPRGATVRWRYAATPALTRLFRPAGTAASQAGPEGHETTPRPVGDRLICVRYRYDAERKKQFKTVEVIVAERDWEPPRPRFTPDKIVGLRVAFADVAVRDRVEQAGGTWNPERRVWLLRYDRVVALGLGSRIVDEPASNSGCPR